MNSIKSILKDLYQIDPTLKEHEKDLEKLLNELIKSQPDIQLDRQFVQKSP